MPSVVTSDASIGWTAAPVAKPMLIITKIAFSKSSRCSNKPAGSYRNFSLPHCA